MATTYERDTVSYDDENKEQDQYQRYWSKLSISCKNCKKRDKEPCGSKWVINVETNTARCEGFIPDYDRSEQ